MSSPYSSPQNRPHGPYGHPGGHWGPPAPHQAPGAAYPAVPGAAQWNAPGAPGGSSGPGTAAFGRRLAARLIDYVLVVIAAVAFFMMMVVFSMVITDGSSSSEAEGAYWGILMLFGWGVLLFFYDWLYLVTWGRTLGKMMLGIKVVSAADGGKLSQGQAIGRSALFGLPQCLPFAGHLFAIAESLAMLGDSRSRALHDRTAGTLVIRTY